MKENKKDAAHFKNIKKFKVAMAVIATLFFADCCSSQEIHSAAGLRAAYGGLISYQHKLNNSYLAEGIIATRWGGVEITALAEKYHPAFNSSKTFWYAGAGMHLGFHGRDNGIHPDKNKNKRIFINPGIDVLGGLAYYFEDIPIQVSIDYKPSFHFSGRRWFVGEGIAVSARYVIK